MKKFLCLLFVLPLLFSCGGSEEKNGEVKNCEDDGKGGELCTIKYYEDGKLTRMVKYEKVDEKPKKTIQEKKYDQSGLLEYEFRIEGDTIEYIMSLFEEGGREERYKYLKRKDVKELVKEYNKDNVLNPKRSGLRGDNRKWVDFPEEQKRDRYMKELIKERVKLDKYYLGKPLN